MASQDFADRPSKKLLLFDVDGTLSLARQVCPQVVCLLVNEWAKMSLKSASIEILDLLKELRRKHAIGFVGGSDLVKITEQLNVAGRNGTWELSGPV